MRLDPLTRILAWIAPQAALRRASARHALDGLRAYDGAGQGRRMRNWQAGNKGPGDEVGFALAKLRARSRDLTRNNPYARRAIDIIVAHQVGYGIMPRPRTGSPAADRRVKQLFAQWATQCDAAGLLDFYGIQALAARTRAEAGEVLIRINRTMPTAERPIGLTLQVLEPDHLDETKNDKPANGNRTAFGVEIDERGRPVAYWLYPFHPGDMTTPITDLRLSERVPAADVIHLFRADRPGQLRGVPDCAPVITRLRGLDDYQEAELERARVQACLAAFVTTSGSPDGGPLRGTIAPGETDRRTTMAPGMIEALLPGEDVKFVAPATGGSYGEHTKAVLRAIAVGFGVSYHQLAGDLSDANYSSLRAGNIEFRRMTEQAQWLLLIPCLCERIWREFIGMAVLGGALRPRVAGYPVEWVPPAFEAIDPLKDAQAERERIDLMLTSPQRAIAAQGYDPAEIMAEAAEWKAAKEAAGLGAPSPAAAPESEDDSSDEVSA